MRHPAWSDDLNLHSSSQVGTLEWKCKNCCSTGNIIRSWKIASCFETGWGTSAWTLDDSVGLYCLRKNQIQVGSATQCCYSRDPGVRGIPVRKIMTHLFLICCLQKGTDYASSCSHWKYVVRDFATCSPTGWAFLTALASWIQNCQDILYSFATNPNKLD